MEKNYKSTTTTRTILPQSHLPFLILCERAHKTMSTYYISLPSTTSPSLPQAYQRTNTLAVTSLPKTFFHPLVLDVLRSHFASFGEINQWVPLPGFGRIIIVYHEEDCAEAAKRLCDPIVLQGSHDMYENLAFSDFDLSYSYDLSSPGPKSLCEYTAQILILSFLVAPRQHLYLKTTTFDHPRSRRTS